MKILMSPSEVLGYFAPSEQLREELVSEYHILLAQEKFLCPVLGQRVVERLCEGGYEEYVEEYLRQPLISLVRYLVLGEQMVTVGIQGVQQYYGATSKPASVEVVERLRRMLLSQAQTMLRRAVEHLDSYEELRSIYVNDTSRSHTQIIGGVIL